ncbi:signal recognition particle protein [Candidatus Woesearchaeota archaeon]|nr:signal recognition particle protein [Candidatus Woesearchaeota archaeon]
MPSFGESLRKALKRIAETVGFTDKELEEVIRELQRELIKADVGVKDVLELTRTIKERARKEEPAAGLTKKEHIINILYEELTRFLGEESREIVISKKPYKIMLVGLFGSGKTTTAAKLAAYYQKRGYSVVLVQTDTYRPAALEQLKQLGKKINVEVIGIEDTSNRNPRYVADWYKSIEPKIKKHDIIIIDTAGRDSLSQELIEEIKHLKRAVNPDEVFLVLSADIGQAAGSQAKAFREATGITGIIVTKMDGTARAGGALVAATHTNAKVLFLGVGEGIDDIERYEPKRFVSRLLGMGDLESLLEKAREAISEDKAEELGKRFLKGEFTLIDMYEQMEAMSKMGPLKKVLSMIPGLSLAVPDELVENQQERLEKLKHIMQSMTKQELESPEIIDYSRIKRIASGSGTSEQEVRQLISQYKKMKKFMKNIKNEKDLKKLMKRFNIGLG